jgi:DNA-binding CsgD family transcriptional regulator
LIRNLVKRSQDGNVDDLTPQEVQIATLPAGGKRPARRQQAIFLSPKTIDYHLRHVYLKLDTLSR